jgi:hypothetical protein
MGGGDALFSLSRLRGRVGEGAAAVRQSQVSCRVESQGAPPQTNPPTGAGGAPVRGAPRRESNLAA